MKVENFLINNARKFLEWKNNRHIITDANIFETLVVEKALSMAKSKNIVYSMNRKTLVYNLLDIYHWETTRKRKIYNFPKAFLFVGLLDYAISKRDVLLIERIANSFESYINFDGTPTFYFDKVDQVPFAIAALNLYKYLGDEKYKKLSDFAYQKLISWADPISRIIPYRKGSKVLLNDLLGMVCPFLVQYGVNFKNTDAIDLANKQIEFFINYGVEKNSHLPFHGINNATKIKVGPTNWGRGIGWYILALSTYSKLEKFNGVDLVKIELSNLIKTLNLLKTKDSVWSQFPGSSERFDASATTMFMYGINSTISKSYSKEEITRLLGKYIDKQGAITNTSGETFGLNSYSTTFGKSEFTQGILLMLLSTTYQ